VSAPPLLSVSCSSDSSDAKTHSDCSLFLSTRFDASAVQPPVSEKGLALYRKATLLGSQFRRASSLSLQERSD